MDSLSFHLVQKSPVTSEQLSEDAKNRIAEITKSTLQVSSGSWKVLITCQPQGWEVTLRTLVAAGVSPSGIKRLDIDAPQVGEVIAHVQQVPGLTNLLCRRELQRVLCNLKILDWVIHSLLISPFSASREWVGESDVIDWIWDHWVGQTPRKHARAALLRLLGELEGRKLSGAVIVAEIPRSELALLGELEADRLIRVEGPAVQFSHDLLSDWARLQVLIAAGDDALTRLKQESLVPRWGRAIRLYAQRLLEQGTGFGDWKASLDELTGQTDDAAIAGDFFIDGVVFAANAQWLLGQMWPGFVADKGRTLRRLLKRFLHVATIPDPRFRDVVEPEDADKAAVWFRIPYPLYWYPFLRALSQHPAELSKLALFESAELCELWLRTMPLNLPGRAEAARIAIVLAREAQGLLAEDVFFSERCDQKIYEALLRAATEFPEEVSQVALELSERRDESPEISQRTFDAAKRREHDRQAYWRQHPEMVERSRNLPPPLSSFRGPLRQAAPDGPRQRVQESFQAAVLNTHSLSGLMSVGPDIAREILLAVCIEEPRPEDFNDFPPLLRDFGIAHWQGGHPEMFFKGPFYLFLQLAPKVGLDAIVRLVNYATERWLEGNLGRTPSEEDRGAYALEFVYQGRAFRWMGCHDVFGWHRGILIGAEAVVCALMALEKWLYQEIESGNTIDEWVEMLFQHARSVAFAGVLTSVGMKYPSLFTGVLQPLLGNITLYNWQESSALGEVQRLWQIGMQSWANSGERIFNIARDWHSMPHRRILLRDVVPQLMFSDDGTRGYIAERRAEWSKLLNEPDSDRDSLEFFLARFDPSNYIKVELPDGTVQIEHRWPAHLEIKAQEMRQTLEVRQLALSMPHLARNCLSGQERIEEDKLSFFWEKLQFLVAKQGEFESVEYWGERIAEGIVGGIAVLFLQHQDWLAANPDRQKWCWEYLRKLEPCSESESRSAHVNQDSSLEAFRGEAAVALLAESDEDWVKQAVFEAITGSYYRSTFWVMTAAFRLRERLRPKFGILQNIVVMWAALRLGAAYASRNQSNSTLLGAYRKILLNRFLAGRIPSDLISFERAERIGHRLLERAKRNTLPDWKQYEIPQERRDRRVSREQPGLDLYLLQNGFGYVEEMAQASTESEKDELIRCCRELLGVVLRMMPRDITEGEEVDSTPYEYDRWIFERVAQIIPGTGSAEVARSLWQPILELGPAAHFWVEDFLVEWFRTGLRAGPDPHGFSQTWKEMIEFTFKSPAWNPQGSRYGFHLANMASELVGLRFAVVFLKAEQYGPLIREMIPYYEQWASRWLRFADIGERFALFITTSSGKILIPMGIKKLSSALPSYSDYDWERAELPAALSEAVRACWKYERKALKTDQGLREAFLAILNALCARLNQDALQLRSEVAESLGGN